MHRWSLNLTCSVIQVPKLPKCTFSSTILLIMPCEVQITIFKSGSVYTYVELTCGPKFYIYLFCSTLIFLKFPPKFYFISKYFFQYFLQNLFFYLFLYIFWQYEFHFHIKFLYIPFVFKHNCISKFIMLFLQVYVLYLNKLYNFLFSLNNFDLDLM